jgi:hypothetical protein
MTIRNYTSKSQQTALTGSVTSGATIFPVVSATTLLGGATISTGQTFTVVIDPDTSLEEIVDVTAVSANNLTVTRGADTTSAQSHAAGAVIRHMIIGRDLREPNTHINASSGVHGITGNVVGDADSQTLTNKTMDGGSNTFTNIGVSSLSTSVVTLTGTQTLTNKTLTSPTINGGTVSSATVTSATIVSGTLSSDLAAGTHKITNLSDPASAQDAATKNYVDTQITNLVNGAPVSLNQLNELAAAINNDASFSTTLTTALGTKLPLAGGTMTGAINMGTNKVTNMGTPTASTDAATKGYIDTIFGSTTSAAASATAAATSATSAAASATAAATSATSAAASQTAAATSATSAAASATAAATSASSAATSASSSLTSQTSAAASATAAATSATSAAASATAAATSATSSATSASAALTSANNAATSASAALTSANSAATSASSALTSQTAAATSAANALTTYNTYKTYYLGSFTTAPTLDNQGNALITGATYWNSSTNTMYAWSGSVWSAISSTSAVTAVSGTSGNITSSGGSTPVINLATAGTAGTYAYPSSVVTDAYGRVTSITSATTTGTGNTVLATSPTLVTPTLGVATGTSLALSFSGSSSSQGSLSVGGNINGGPDTGLIATFAGAQATYAYTLVQNTTNGASSYASMTVANNDFSSYIDVGVNSSTYSSTSAGYVNNSFSQPKMNFIEATGGDLTVGTWSSGTTLHFVVGGTSATADSMSISSSTVTVPSLTLTGSLTAASTSGTSGQLLQSTGTGVQWTTFSSAPWTAASTSANTTMVTRYQYFVNTGSAVTMTLPASANLGDEIRVFDATGSAATNNITVAPNGLNIQGSVQNLLIDVNYGGATLLYTGSTYGWKVA